MELWDDPKFQQACKDVSAIVAGPWGLKPVDVEQGAREVGDEMRRPKSQGGQFGRNPTTMEMALGYALRSGGTVRHEDFVAVLPKLSELQECLWR